MRRAKSAELRGRLKPSRHGEILRIYFAARPAPDSFFDHALHNYASNVITIAVLLCGIWLLDRVFATAISCGTREWASARWLARLANSGGLSSPVKRFGTVIAVFSGFLSMPRIFALCVIGLLFVLAVVLVVWIGSLPARIARRRHHPQVDSINAMSWLGLLLTGGVGWGIALVWALIRYDARPPAASQEKMPEEVATKTRELESRIAKLEQLLANSADRERKA
jgi:hypothetical protein